MTEGLCIDCGLRPRTRRYHRCAPCRARRDYPSLAVHRPPAAGISVPLADRVHSAIMRARASHRRAG